MNGQSFFSCILIALVFVAVVAAITYAVRAVSGKSHTVPTALAFGLCMLAPVVMAQQEWDDHDRSNKTLAPSMARNYLESCAPNAILFTFGDNDTYPLWYAQEVEGVRPDIRIINTSLLGIDWYVNQLRYKVNGSDPIDVIWTADQIRGVPYILYQPRGQQERHYDLYDVMKNVIGQQSPIANFPVKRFRIPVDQAALRQFNVVNPTDSTMPEMLIELAEGKNVLTLDQMTMLNIIAANNWKRPIYFTSPYGELGFGQYLRKEGLTYRLVPVQPAFPQQNWVVDRAMRDARLGGTAIRDNNQEVMFKNLMSKFNAGNANIFGTYFDEENRRHLLAVRSTFAEAAGNLSDANRKAEAQQLLQKAESLIDPRNLPYAMTSRYNSHNQTALIYLEAAYKSGNTELAGKLRQSISKDLQDQKKYYEYLRSEREELYQSLVIEDEINNALIQVFETVEKAYGGKGGAPAENVGTPPPAPATQAPRP